MRVRACVRACVRVCLRVCVCVCVCARARACVTDRGGGEEDAVLRTDRSDFPCD